METNYYIVKTKCGHVGRNNYIIIDYPITASSKKEAAQNARHRPRVKHNHKDAIIEVREVDYNEYLQFKNQFRKNPYIKSSTIQQQRILYPDYYMDRIEEKRMKIQHKKRTVLFKLLRQLIAVSDFDSRDYNEMKSSYLWQNKRFSQN